MTTLPLTRDYVRSIVEPAAHGDWKLFIDTIDPDVHWIVADPVFNSTSLTGTYNLQEWQDKLAGPLFSRLIEGGVKMRIDELDVVGQKAILECSGFATQKNGKPYNNRFCWIIIFSDAGKMVTVREYVNTALIREVMTGN